MYDKITLFALHRNDFGFGYAYKLIYKWQSAVFLDIFPHILPVYYEYNEYYWLIIVYKQHCYNTVSYGNLSLGR